MREVCFSPNRSSPQCLPFLLFERYQHLAWVCSQEEGNACTCIYLHHWDTSSSSRIFPSQQTPGKIYRRCLICILWCTIFPFSRSTCPIHLLLVSPIICLQWRSWWAVSFDQHKGRFLQSYQVWDHVSRCISFPFGRDLVWSRGRRCLLDLLPPLLPLLTCWHHCKES